MCAHLIRPFDHPLRHSAIHHQYLLLRIDSSLSPSTPPLSLSNRCTTLITSAFCRRSLGPQHVGDGDPSLIPLGEAAASREAVLVLSLPQTMLFPFEDVDEENGE